MDKVAQRLADRAHELTGIYLDIEFSDWEHSAGKQREFWRELARVSQEPEPEKQGRKPRAKA